MLRNRGGLIFVTVPLSIVSFLLFGVGVPQWLLWSSSLVCHGIFYIMFYSGG